MNALNGLLFGCLIAGHAWLWVAFVNRIHAIPLHCATLHRIRRIHDVMLVVGPPLLIVNVGLTGPRLLLGGSWASIPAGVLSVLGLCGLGFVGLVATSLRHQFSALPSPVRLLASNVHKIGEHPDEWPIGRGKYQRLVRLRCNEQFQVESNVKQFSFANLPAEWDGVSILHISDWHFYGPVGKAYFEQVSQIAAAEPVDLVLFTGDLIDNMELLDWIPETLGMLQGKYGRYFILGNHDWYQSPDVIRSAMNSAGWTDVASRTIDIDIHGHTLQLGGDETPWMGRPPQWTAGPDFRILLAHTPDRIMSAEARQADLVLAGHNHGGQVQLPWIGPVYSPSRYGTRFAAGVFRRHHTLMHVSRGLSGHHPFRFRCRPEVTRLVLRREFNPS